MGKQTRELNNNRILNRTISQFINENWGYRNQTFYYNTNNLTKFEYGSKFREHFAEKPLYFDSYVMEMPPIPPQPKNMRDCHIKKILCSVLKDLQAKKKRELVDKDLLEIDFEQIERLVDFNYNELMKSKLKPIKKKLNVDKIIKESGLLV